MYALKVALIGCAMVAWSATARRSVGASEASPGAAGSQGTMVRPTVPAPTDDLRAVWQRAECHYRAHQWQQAADGFAHLVQHLPAGNSRIHALFYLAEAHMELQHYDAAAQAYARLHREQRDENWPFASRVCFRWGEALYWSEQWVAARSQLEQFVRDYPHDALQSDALPYLGHLALRAQQPRAAKQWYERALARDGQGPFAAECRIRLGRVCEQLKEHDAARAWYDKVIATEVGQLRHQALFYRGLLDFKLERYVSARSSMEELIAASSSGGYEIVARYWSGRCLLAQQQFHAALDAFQQALDLAPQHTLAADLLFFAGEARRLGGEPDEAAELYLGVVQQWPTSRWAQPARQRLERLTPQTLTRLESVAEQDATLTTHPGASQPDDVRAGIAGDAVAPRGDMEAAKQTLAAELHQARAALEAGEFKTAERTLKSVLRDTRAIGSEAAPQAHTMLGEVYYRQGDYEQALRMFLTVETLYDDWPRWQQLALRKATVCYDRAGHARIARVLEERNARKYGATAQRP